MKYYLNEGSYHVNGLPEPVKRAVLNEVLPQRR